ncbi:MAG: antitoxin [Acidimicrobiales bacterium]|nr:antitoxin [Acidimicrobiales bacterium]
MGLMDKAKGLLQGKGDQAEDLIDKAAGMAKDRTGGKHADKIDSAAQKAKDAVDKIDTSDEK